MAPKKRARTAAGRASASSSSQPATAATKLMLRGGVPHHVFGGESGEGPLSTAEVYDPASDSWAQVSNLTSARNGMVTIAL